jgi:hypothetical protein
MVLPQILMKSVDFELKWSFANDAIVSYKYSIKYYSVNKLLKFYLCIKSMR